MSWKEILNKFGFSWSLEDIWYRMFSSSPRPKSVKDYLIRNIAKTRVLMQTGRIPSFRYKFKSRDKVVLECFKWVVDNISYLSDKKNYGEDEYWEDIDLVVTRGKADCESMSLLLFCMMEANGINPLQMKYTAGKVKTADNPILGSGHAWIEYQADEPNDWFILDPAYKPKNITTFNYRQEVVYDTGYIKRWFQITSLDLND